jgi:MFS family permease
MDSLTYFQLLRRNRSFRRLWWGQVISELGNWFNFIAGLGLVRVISDGAPGATAIFLLTRMVPLTLFLPLAGAFVDRWSRRMVMIVSDFARVAIALGFLLVRRPEDLWIAYLCTALLSFFHAFFEAAKSAATPNITGERDLLAGNALMFSSRFLLMSLGAALGGWTAATVGYRAAFIVNAVSFLGSALSVWLIPEQETRELPPEKDISEIQGEVSEIRPDQRDQRDQWDQWDQRDRGDRRDRGEKKPSYWSDIREGWAYIIRHAPVAALLAINVLWALGGGSVNLIMDRLGGIIFAGQRGISGDSAVAALYFAGGLGLFFGMMIARRLGHYFEFLGKTPALIGWGLIVQGFLFAVIGFVPSLWWACVFIFLSRTVLGAEFGVQDTLLMRLVPDKLRGRVITTDRATELLTWSVATTIAGWSLHVITPRTLTVVSGLLSSCAGAVWLILFATGRVRLPKRLR